MKHTELNTPADLSLVLCTYGRTEDVNRFLESISNQTIKPREIIIIDQNEEDFLEKIISKWNLELNIVHK